MIQQMILCLLVACVLALLLYPVAIPFLHRIKVGQSVYELGPKSHYVKNGTPIMGGVVFVLTSLLATLFICPKAYLDKTFLLVVLAFVGYGIIGFIDDFIIVVKHNHDGLKAKQKFLLQSILAIIFYLLYRTTGQSLNYITIPFTSIQIELGWFYFIVVFFLFTGTSNAVNLADGLDGLCAGLSILAYIPYIYFFYRIYTAGTLTNSSSMIYIMNLLASVIGSLLGYLRYNYHPAKIFMGDTGSLALGGLLAAIAMVSKQELSLIIIGGVFVVETLSVIMQVISYQTTGKRIFKMTPIHHHFELSGWKETKVVWVFWFVGLILATIGIIMGVIM